MKTGRLSERNFWEDFYRRRENKAYLPNPNRSRNHFELDLIFKSFLRPDSSTKLLELGAGDSIWLPYFAKNFRFKVYGIDYSPKGCEMAKVNLELAEVEGEVICADFFQLDEKWNGYFDIIISFGVIEHFEDPSMICGLIKRLLKKNGLVITVVPNTASLLMRFQKFVDEEVYRTHKIFDLTQLSDFHKQAGFKIVFECYFQFMDLSILNYRKVVSKGMFKLIARSITALNLPILYFQKLFHWFPQSRRLCSSMVVIAKNI